MTDSRKIEITGDVVKRPAKPWTSTVHALLRHLHAAGLPVPEPLDLDESTETVRLLPGDAGQDAWPHQLTLDGVRSAGRLLRDIHDATVDWSPPVDAVWSVPSSGGEVICHGDPQPANLVWSQGRVVGIFDWDAARPAGRINDVAYALEWLTPFIDDQQELLRRGFGDGPDRGNRAQALLGGYGWTEPIDVVEEVAKRQAQAIDEVVHLGRLGHEPHATWVAEGWPEKWQSHMTVTRSLRNTVGDHLP